MVSSDGNGLDVRTDAPIDDENYSVEAHAEFHKFITKTLGSDTMHAYWRMMGPGQYRSIDPWGYKLLINIDINSSGGVQSKYKRLEEATREDKERIEEAGGCEQQ